MFVLHLFKTEVYNYDLVVFSYADTVNHMTTPAQMREHFIKSLHFLVCAVSFSVILTHLVI